MILFFHGIYHVHDYCRGDPLPLVLPDIGLLHLDIDDEVVELTQIAVVAKPGVLLLQGISLSPWQSLPNRNATALLSCESRVIESIAEGTWRVRLIGQICHAQVVHRCVFLHVFSCRALIVTRSVHVSQRVL